MPPEPSSLPTSQESGPWLDPRDEGAWEHRAFGSLRLWRRPFAGATFLAVATALVAVAVAIAEGLPIRDPDGVLGSRMGILVGSVTLFLALDILPRAVRRAGVRPGALARAALDIRAERWGRRRLAVVAFGLLSFYATYIAYRNLKSFLPLILPQDLDGALAEADRWLFLGHDPAALLHAVLGTGVAAHVLSAVYLFYLAFIPISLGAALILSVNPLPGLWYVTALGLNWTLGVASYYLLPSLGPVFFDPGQFAELPVTGVTRLQETLFVDRAIVLADPSATPAVQSIAAFASLHVSVVFTAALMAHLLGLARWLRWALWCFLALTLLATVYFGWHYVLDDVAGLLIGFVAVAVGAVATGHGQILRRTGRLGLLR